MQISFDHVGFQRTALRVMGCGGAGALAASVAGAAPLPFAAATLGAAALPLAFELVRAARDGRLAVSLPGAAVGLGAACFTWWTLALDLGGARGGPPGLIGGVGLGLLAGLVASLGLVASSLRIRRDAAGEALEAARPALDRAGLALCERAAAAGAKISAAARRADSGPEARRVAEEVDSVAGRVVLEIVALCRRQRAVAREAEAPAAELDARLAELDAQLAGVTDDIARDSYGRARAALEDQRRRLGALRVTAERVLARLHTEVAALEGAALAIAARGGAATAEDAAALAPLADRLRATSGEAELQAEAAREVAAVY